ncbi:amidohydrolase [Pelosinus fermentans]|uniref:Amidohydrolase n=1 Tax=Pelosinus fermentans B4 TaxID=1149862 RepID=I8RKT7_9FIRM|nr:MULTISPECIES: amidohydrolase [Pelosinus]EIW19080.1 amidohydrolase [Pelosinus fermentans B4]OAM95442.1 amidohydrolase [Pelosinus fermentans DSM 17108]SDR28089.1 amidohydrolase [Pelosinus fermentans]
MQIIKGLIEKHYDSIVSLRRHFHTYPELSAQEYNTQQRILEELSALGLAPHKIAGTGVIAKLQGALPGKTIAIRADIDALELQDECGKPYQSQTPGVCHACGHDGHTAMLIGAAKTLVELKDRLAGTIIFLFQPSEECFPGGAAPMVEEGALADVDAIIGTHLWQSLSSGTSGISYNRMMASPDSFTITIKGRGGHGSMPHQTVDALLVGAQVVTALHTIISRNIDPLEQAVLSIGSFKSGDTFNIIPDTATLIGTVRSFTMEIKKIVFDRMEQIVSGICLAAGATFQIEKNLGFPPVINNPQIAEVFANASVETLGAENTLTIDPVMGGEDFSVYLEKVPGAFIFIGTGNKDKGIIYPQHHPKFDIDEKALAYGTEIMVRTAMKLSSSNENLKR